MAFRGLKLSSLHRFFICRNAQRCISIGTMRYENASWQSYGQASMIKWKLQRITFPIIRMLSYPSHKVIKLPNLSPTMETGSVVSWAKNEGDEVNEGDLLAEIETDKATMSLDASDSGFLAKIISAAGSKDIPVGTPLCIIVEESESVGAFEDYKADIVAEPAAPPPVKPAEPLPAPSSQPPPPPPAPKPSTTPAPPTAPRPTPNIQSSGQTGRVFASPLARRLAAEQGIDLQQLASSKSGSGIRGSFRAADLVGVQPTPATSGFMAVPSVGAFSDFPITTMRSELARRMASSQLDIPHYYLTTDIEMDELLQMRDNLNATLKKRGAKEDEVVGISLNDILVKAVAMTCRQVPDCNASWQGDFIRQYHSVDVNVAVATPMGLITPVVFGAETKGLSQISQEIHELICKAKENTLQPSEYQTGTFTISNLGMFGINSFSAIINPPQACLLGAGSIQQSVRPNPSSSNHYVVNNVMSVTLCCDHRVIDGAVGASWLSEFKSLLEKPTLMLL